MITLTGEPRSTNNIYRSVCRGNFPSVYLSAEGKTLKEQYQLEAKIQWGRKPLLSGPVSLSARFYFKTLRKRDLDNGNKLLLDSLTGIIYEDDSQIDQLILTRDYDKKNPRIEITITSI